MDRFALDDPEAAAALTAYFEPGIAEAERVPSVEAARAMIPTDPISRLVDRLFFDCN